MIRGIQLAWGQRLKTIAAIWGRSCRWAASLFGRRYRLVMVEGRFPTKLNRQRLYVLTEDGLPWEAAMICPCGCGATLHMNLLADERPRWHYSHTGRGYPTLRPSVWRQVGCRAHFVLREGRVRWV
jgi:hypothetical protein